MMNKEVALKLRKNFQIGLVSSEDTVKGITQVLGWCTEDLAGYIMSSSSLMMLDDVIGYEHGIWQMNNDTSVVYHDVI